MIEQDLVPAPGLMVDPVRISERTIQEIAADYDGAAKHCCEFAWEAVSTHGDKSLAQLAEIVGVSKTTLAEQAEVGEFFPAAAWVEGASYSAHLLAVRLAIKKHGKDDAEAVRLAAADTLSRVSNVAGLKRLMRAADGKAPRKAKKPRVAVPVVQYPVEMGKRGAEVVRLTPKFLAAVVALPESLRRKGLAPLIATLQGLAGMEVAS